MDLLPLADLDIDLADFECNSRSNNIGSGFPNLRGVAKLLLSNVSCRPTSSPLDDNTIDMANSNTLARIILRHRGRWMLNSFMFNIFVHTLCMFAERDRVDKHSLFIYFPVETCSSTISNIPKVHCIITGATPPLLILAVSTL